jgi:hypothetical protein
MTRERLEDVALNMTAMVLAAAIWFTGGVILLYENTSRRLTVD